MEERKIKLALIAISLFAAVVIAFTQFHYNFSTNSTSNDRVPASTKVAPELE